MKDTTHLPTVLILADSGEDQTTMADALAQHFDCLQASTAKEAWALLTDHFVQVVIRCGPVPDASVAEVSTHLHRTWPDTMQVIVTNRLDDVLASHPETQHVVPRTWTADVLRHTVSAAARAFRLARENERLSLELRCLAAPRMRQAPAADLGFEGILRSPGSPMAGVVASARQFASFDVPILIVGEPGTGKADLARAIHDSSLRSDRPFQFLDVTGLSSEAISVALFGTRKPGNGGAGTVRAGLVRKADHGTLCICGVETLSHDLQLRLLRLVRDGIFETDGSPDAEASNVRIIALSRSDLQPSTDPGEFDPALYFSLSIAELHLPPLRDRKGDIPVLTRAMIDKVSQANGKIVHGIRDDALAFLTDYPWPGNLRELENEITRMLILSQDAYLDADVISRRILQAQPGPSDPTQTSIMERDGSLKDRIEAIEARILRETLTRLRWNKSRSAAELGLSRVGLRAKLDRYGIAQQRNQTEEV